MLFAPQHRTIDDALASYERTMLERVRGAIAEATADHLIAATGPGPLPADYGGETIWARLGALSRSTDGSASVR